MQSRPKKRVSVDWVERILQVHVLSIAVLAGLLVDLNRDGERVAGILGIAAVCGFVLTDLLRWFHIPRFLVGVITLSAIVPLSMGFWESDTQGQLNQITYLLTIWLSVIFFQQKTPRVYGSLTVLSLLLVVIAAILSNGIPFAILLFLYEFAALSAMVLLYVHTGQRSLQSKYQAALNQVPELAQPMRNSYASLLGRPPIAFQDPRSLPQRGRMWHRATIVHTLGMCAATVVFGCGFFYAVPRVNQGDWTTPREVLGPKVGFSSELTFEEMGKILQSDELAFRITFSDARTGKDYELVQEAYVQGIALTQYDIDSQGRSSWRQPDQGAGLQLSNVDEDYKGDVIRQEIVLQPTSETTLFAVPPVFGSSDTEDFIRIDRQGGRIFRPQVDAHGTGRQHRYVVYTTGFHNNAQTPLVPITRFGLFSRQRTLAHEISAAEKERLLAIDESRFPKLIALARKIQAQSVEPDNRISLARQLLDHFQSEDRFTYTLDLRKVQEKRNRNVDPIEDFVGNHHTGHCEYYASALALMLRSVHIPSRVIVGYYGGEFNRLGGYYQIYQRDAHAWVEAYLEPDQVPRGPLSEAIPEGGAAWYRLDPTPPEKQDLTKKGPMATVDQVLDYAQALWNDYVLDMNAEQQRAAILSDEAPSGPFGPSPLSQQLRDLLSSWLQIPQEFLADWRRAGWWNWRGGVVAAVVTALVYLLYAIIKWVRARWNARQLAKRRQIRRAMQTVEFYRRLEQLLAKIGCQRRATQTQREFAIEVGQALAESLSATDAVHIPARIVEYFYRVRFGQQPLAPNEQREVEEFLRAMDAVVTTIPTSNL